MADPFAFLSGDSLGVFMDNEPSSSSSSSSKVNSSRGSHALKRRRRGEMESTDHNSRIYPSDRRQNQPSLSSSSSVPGSSSMMMDAAAAESQPPRRKRQRYPNDGGLSDEAYLAIIKARELETPEMIQSWIEERKKNYPTRANIARKRELIQAKKNRAQPLTLTEKIQDFSDQTGCQRTPSIFRFMRAPRHKLNLLEKVLHREIDEENSAILQCFRFMVQNHFFDEQLKDEGKECGNDDQQTESDSETKKKKEEDTSEIDTQYNMNDFQFEDEFDNDIPDEMEVT